MEKCVQRSCWSPTSPRRAIYLLILLVTCAQVGCIGAGPSRRAQTTPQGQWDLSAGVAVTGTTVERAADVVVPEARVDASYGVARDWSINGGVTVVPIGMGLWGGDFMLQRQWSLPASLTLGAAVNTGIRHGTYGGLSGQLYALNAPIMLDIPLWRETLWLTPSIAPGVTMISSPGTSNVLAPSFDAGLGVRFAMTSSMGLHLEGRALRSPTTLEGEDGAWLGHIRLSMVMSL